MSTTRLPRDSSDRARTAGSSLALSLAVVLIVLLILAAGAFFMLRDDDDPDDTQLGAIPSPSGTSELVDLGATPTPDGLSAQATSSPTEDATATEAAPSPSPSATATETEVVEPTATEEVVEEEPTEPEELEPTPTLEPEPEPTEAPLEGEFGFLPAAQLPSGGVAGTLSLEYQLGMSLESLPTTGTVYLIEWPTYTLADVELARDQLGLDGEVIEEGVGVYRVSGETGTLYVSPSEIVFNAAGAGGGEGLPGDADAIAIASEWIGLSAFLGGDMDSGEVVVRDEDAQRVIVKFRPYAPQPNLAPNPAATVNIGPGGTVLEVRIAWPAGLIPSDYGYTDPLALWQAVQSGQGFLEADISGVFATGPLSGVATIYDYSTAYTLAGSPAGGQYLVPVIRFEGSARIDQTGDEIPVWVSVPVVWAQQGTAG